MMDPKPEQYAVYWYDWDKCERIAKQRGVDGEDVEPAEYEERADFDELEQARVFCREKEPAGAYIEKRINIRREHVEGPIWRWDWEQERVD